MSLVETMMSITILAIVLGAMTSAVVVASRALPGRNDRIEAVTQGARVADRILADLAYARSITLTGTTTLTGVVPDRDADTKDETIVYEWSGAKGGTLTRTYNSEEPAIVATGVWSFAPSCLSRTATIPTTVLQESDEQLLHYQPVGNVAPPPGLMNPYSGNPGTKDVTSTRWPAQHVHPILPAGATAWSVKRVLLCARISGISLGVSQVEIRRSSAFPGGPVSSVIQDRALSEGDLTSTFTWRTLSFSAVNNLSPSTGVWIVVRPGLLSAKPTLAYQSSDNADIYAAYAESSNSGSTWAQSQDAALAHALYGTYTIPVASTTTETRATSLSIRLNLSADSGAAIETATRLANEPLLVVNP
jgi:hypothetical protein